MKKQKRRKESVSACFQSPTVREKKVKKLPDS
jgi:hypothetical protein